MHQQQQLQHQQFQKELEKIQLLQQQQLPFHAPGDVAPDAELLDSSGLYSESSGTSSPSTSPRASNHSLHSSGSASRTGASPFLEQDDEGKASCRLVLFSLSFDHHPRTTRHRGLPGSCMGLRSAVPQGSLCSHLTASHSGGQTSAPSHGFSPRRAYWGPLGPFSILPRKGQKALL